MHDCARRVGARRLQVSDSITIALSRKPGTERASASPPDPVHGPNRVILAPVWFTTGFPRRDAVDGRPAHSASGHSGR